MKKPIQEKKMLLKRKKASSIKKSFYFVCFFSFFLSIFLNLSWAKQNKPSSFPPPSSIRPAKWPEPFLKKHKKRVQFSYFSKKDNQKPSQKDFVFLFLKNLKTQELLQIRLTETKNNSSLFEDVFDLDWKTKSPPWAIYIPDKKFIKPQKMFPSLDQKQLRMGKKFSHKNKKKKKSSSLILFARRILNKKEKPHIYVLHLPSEKGKKNSFEKLQIYPSKKSMEKHLKRQTASFKLYFHMQNQKYRIRKQENHFLSEKEKKEKKKKAQAMAERAFENYKKKDFKQAELLFQKSLISNPETRKSHFNYALSLYRNKKFKKALVELALAKKETQEESKINIEINYYMALILYEMKNEKPALRLFKNISQLKEEKFSPIASFYQALILYSNKKFKLALRAFIQASETSNDSKIVKLSKEYIEKTKNILSIQKRSKTKLSLRGNIGILFDSHLLSPIDVQEIEDKIRERRAEIPKSPGGRYLLRGDLAYHLLKKKQTNLHLEMNSIYLYSFQDKHSYYDPFSFSLSLPLSWRTKKKKEKDSSSSSQTPKNLSKNRWEMAPHFEKIFMDFNQNGRREDILTSYGIKTDLFRFHTKRWQALYSLHLFLQNKNRDTEEENKSQDTKASLETKHFFFSKKSRESFFLLHLGGESYFSKNTIRKYLKAHFQTAYQKAFKILMPFFWNIHFNLSYLFFPDWKNLDFNPNKENKKSKSRKDFQFSISTGLKLSFTDWMFLEGRVGFFQNSSSLSLYSYQNKSALIYLTLLWL